MTNKSHLQFVGSRRLESNTDVKFHYGFPSETEEPEEEPDYRYTAQELRANLQMFSADLSYRIDHRIAELKVPINIDYVQIEFHNQFDIKKFYTTWITRFGLEAVRFTNFNRVGLFAVIDRDLFTTFIQDVNYLIEYGSQTIAEKKFSNLILFVKSFKLLTSSDIIDFNLDEVGSILNVNLIELLEHQKQEILIDSLKQFLAGERIVFNHDTRTNKLELSNATPELVRLLADNFDIIQSITCSLSSVIKPSTFNVAQRDYGFEVSIPDGDLPVIGIIDTGISMDTPLAPVILSDNRFTLDGSNPLIDTSGFREEGHGTAVAALAALGRKAYEQKFRGTISADAMLLSIKLYENGAGYLPESRLVEMLYQAKKAYPSMKVFTLTTCYNRHKLTNEPPSTYTYELDRFAHDTDSLIFISTGNNHKACDDNTFYDPKYFDKEETNLSTPADCMNNFVVGAAANALNGNQAMGVAPDKEFPTLYSRKSHIDLSTVYLSRSGRLSKSNRHLFRPDIIECGGDYEYHLGMVVEGSNTSMQVLSAKPSEGFYRGIGTSFSAPLAANLAAQIQRKYPTLRSQTIKALIINGASHANIRFGDAKGTMAQRVAGNGFLNIDSALHSDENRATLILEDSIADDKMKVYPLAFPRYLLNDDLGKRNGILRVTATLCFSFEPIANNQLSYCPLHMAFTVFKNHTEAQIIAKDKDVKSKLKATLGWSQNGRDVSRPIPYSNSQKIEFVINREELENEELTLKLAVQCRLSAQLLDGVYSSYPKEYNFSMVVSIEETIKENTGKLYDEIALVNELEAITSIDLEASLDLE